MSFADSLRSWLNRSDPIHAQPAEPAQPRGPDGSACCAGCAGQGPDPNIGAPALPEDAHLWGSDAIEHYLERRGIADELGLDTAPGSLAEIIARREARRVMAGLPPSWLATRGQTSIDAVINAFDGARFVGFIDASEIAPVWPETDASRRASNAGHASVDQQAPTQPEVEP